MFDPSEIKQYIARRDQDTVEARISPFLTPNLEEANYFLEALLGYGDKEVSLLTFAEAPNARGAWPSNMKQGRFTDLADWLTYQNQCGYGVAVRVNDGIGPRYAIDLDCDDRMPRAFIDVTGYPVDDPPSGRPKPEIVVETSPGNYHAYWPMFYVARDEFVRRQGVLAARFSSKPYVDPDRFMRLPGFYHMKAEPFLVRLLHPTEDEAIQQQEDGMTVLHEYELLVP